MSKVLVSGIVVALIFTLLPILLPLLPALFAGLDYSWLADGEITLGELVAFLGALLIAFSEQGRAALVQAFGSKK